MTRCHPPNTTLQKNKKQTKHKTGWQGATHQALNCKQNKNKPKTNLDGKVPPTKHYTAKNKNKPKNNTGWQGATHQALNCKKTKTNQKQTWMARCHPPSTTLPKTKNKPKTKLDDKVQPTKH